MNANYTRYFETQETMLHVSLKSAHDSKGPNNKWSLLQAFRPAWGWDKHGHAYNTKLNHTVMHRMFMTGMLTMIAYW